MKELTNERIENLTKAAYEVGPAPLGLDERLARIAEGRRTDVRPRFALRPVMIAAAIATVVAAGATIRWWTWNSGEAGFSDSTGRMWRIPSIHGSIRFFDLKGHEMAVMSAGGTDPQEPTVVSVGGQRFVLRGIGRHEMRSADGKLYGYAEVRATELTPSPKGRSFSEMLDEREAAFRKSVGTGVQGGMGVAFGHDAKSGVFWKVVGEARVFGVWPDGSEFSSEASRFDPQMLKRIDVSPGDFSLPEQPKLTWTAGGRSGEAEGYGPQEIRDASGKIQMTIRIERPTPQP